MIARNSSFIYKGKAVHMKQVAEELGVGYVVEGSVRKGGDRVRITAQLNDVATGSHIWAERYDRELADVFAVQDEITEAIVAAIEPQLYAAENFRAQRKPPDSMDAWDLVMRALSHYWRVTRQDNMVAQALLEKATAIDPNYGQALGVLATSHTFGAHMGWADMATVAPLAERAARAAILADSEDPWAHHALGSVYLFTRRFDDSLAEFELALRLNPNFSLAQGYYGLALSYCGRWEEADLAARRALRLSPRDPFSAIYYGIAAYAQFVGRNYDEAMRLAREGIRQRGDFVGAHRVLTAAAGMSGQGDVAERRIAGASPRAAQYFARLDRQPDADHAGRRSRALSGRFPPRRPRLVPATRNRDTRILYCGVFSTLIVTDSGTPRIPMRYSAPQLNCEVDYENMNKKLMIVVGAALLAGTSAASAQVRDNPPGWAWQHRGILDSEGVNPNRTYRGAYDSYDYVGRAPYRSYGYPSYGYSSYGYRGFRADDPPGARYQDQGIRDWDGGE